MPADNRPNHLTVRVHTDLQELAALEGDWHRICDGTPFRTFQWNYQWAHYFGSQRPLLILSVHDAEDCVGIAPFYVERSLGVGRVVQFLGTGDVASDYQSILSLPERSADVGVAVANWFAGQYNAQRESKHGNGPEVGDLLELDGVDSGCPTFMAFLEQLEQRNFTISDLSTVHTWRIALPQSVDAYLAMLSKPCRRKVRTALKQVDRGDVAVAFAETPEAFQRNWQQFTDLHQRRRQSLGEAGCFACKDFADFLFQVSRMFYESGRLDLVCVLTAGQPVAAEICFRDQTHCFAYQIGIAPEALKLNPGWLVNAVSIRRAIDMGLSSFDLCRGDAEYKRQLGAKPMVCRKLRIVPPRLRSQFLSTSMSTGAAVKHFFQDVMAGATHRS